jgi:hypothetical protein
MMASMGTDQHRSDNEKGSEASDWIRLARGEDLPDSDVIFRAEVSAVDDLVDRGPLTEWSATITAVLVNEDLEDTDCFTVSEAHALSFDLSEGPAALLNAADEHSGDVFGAMSDLLTNELAYDDLLGNHLVRRGLYVEHLSVPEDLRGHGWGACALANLLGALDPDNTLVLCHLPMAGNEFREPVAKIISSFGAQRFASTETFWWHTEQRAQETAIESRLAGPLGGR